MSPAEFFEKMSLPTATDERTRYGTTIWWPATGQVVGFGPMVQPRPTTPRIPPLAPGEGDAQAEELLAELDPNLSAAHIFSTLVRHPGLFRKWSPFGGKLLSAAQNLIGAVTDQLAEAPQSIDEASLRFFFDAMHFVALAEQFGEHSIFDVTLTTDRYAPRDKTSATLCVRNVIPAPFLAPRYAAARTTVMFSGTLSPHHFYRDTLGLPEQTQWLDVEGPFRAEQLQVRVAGNVSTEAPRALAQRSSI
jgi:Rad3-related DNA helicase